MIWIYVFMALSLALCAVTVWLATRIDLLMNDWGIVVFLVTFMAGFAVLGLLLVAIITPISRSYADRNCTRWSNQTGREVKFVRYGDFAWECLTPSKDGKWISKDYFGDYNR